MKKLTVFIGTIMLLALTILPAFAFDGVSGATFNSLNNAPWEHGGTVYLVGTVGTVPNQLLGQGVLSEISGSYGTFDVPFTAIPDNGTDVTVYIVFNFGGVGTPQTQQYTDQFTQFSFITGRYNMGNIRTGTGPTAVSLQDFGTAASNLPLFGIGLVLLVLASITLITIRRRQTT